MKFLGEQPAMPKPIGDIREHMGRKTNPTEVMAALVASGLVEQVPSQPLVYGITRAGLEDLKTWELERAAQAQAYQEEETKRVEKRRRQIANDAKDDNERPNPSGFSRVEQDIIDCVCQNNDWGEPPDVDWITNELHRELPPTEPLERLVARGVLRKKRREDGEVCYLPTRAALVVWSGADLSPTRETPQPSRKRKRRGLFAGIWRLTKFLLVALLLGLIAIVAIAICERA